MNNSTMELFSNDKIILHRIKFIILLTLQIPSIVISILIFLFFITHRACLNILQNQAVLVLLGVNFLLVAADLPIPIHFYYWSYVTPTTAGFCTWWTFFEYSLNLSSELLMAVISVQRHILIFQPHLLQVRLKCFLFYYVPLLACVIYPITFYMIIIVLYPCDGTQWDYTSNLCGYANCYLVYNNILSTFDWAVNNGLPIIIIILANGALLIRFVKQKRRFRQHVAKRRQRRMTLQLICMSSLYLIAWLPSLIIGLGQQLNSPNFLAQFQLDYALDLIYFVCLLLPWVCLRLLPEFTKWIWTQCQCKPAAHNNVRPI